eukprot:jgi/Ulvmu1/9718/UM055_0056.1
MPRRGLHSAGGAAAATGAPARAFPGRVSSGPGEQSAAAAAEQGLPAAAPAPADGGTMLTAATGSGLPVPEEPANVEEGGGLSLNSPTAVGLAAAALVLAALALVAVMLYVLWLRRRRRKRLQRWRLDKSERGPERGPSDAPELPTPRSMDDPPDSGGVSLSFFYHISKTPSKLSDGGTGSRALQQTPSWSVDLHLPQAPTTHAAAGCGEGTAVPLNEVAGLSDTGTYRGLDTPGRESNASAADAGDCRGGARAGSACGDSSFEEGLSSEDDTAAAAGVLGHRRSVEAAPSLAIEALSGTTLSNHDVSTPGAAFAQPAAAVGGAAGGVQLPQGSHGLSSGMGSPVPVRPMLQSMSDPGGLEAAEEARAVVPRDAAAAAVVPRRQADAAQMRARLVLVEQQLDSFWPQGVVLDRYLMLGGDDRCQGGKSVVQFVRNSQEELYAVQFFGSRAAFEEARRLYLHDALARFMPPVVEFVANENGAFCDPFDHPMPPCLVMEKGESLTERAAFGKKDGVGVAKIIGQVASRLSELHSRGWVHRDLKLGNVLFLPRTDSWAFRDFALAARIGEPTSPAHALAYAAPEAAAAHAAGDLAVPADTAADAWAMGVMAFELLTGRPAFKPPMDSEEVQAQLLGEQPLPWEGDRLTHSLRRRLGGFKGPVLRMLSRDPASRPSCQQFAATLRRLCSGPGSPMTSTAPRWTPS